MEPKTKLVLIFLSVSLTMGLVSQAMKNGDMQAKKLPSKKTNHEMHSDPLKESFLSSTRG